MSFLIQELILLQIASQALIYAANLPRILPPLCGNIYTELEHNLNCQQQSFKLQNSLLFLSTAFGKLEMVGNRFIFKLPNK
jgi:hypothetical protein